MRAQPQAVARGRPDTHIKQVTNSLWDLLDLLGLRGSGEEDGGQNFLEHHIGRVSLGGKVKREKGKGENSFSEKQGGENEALLSAEWSGKTQAPGRLHTWPLLAASST